MPTTFRTITRIGALALALGAAGATLAGPRFSLVLGGKIVSVEATGSGADQRVSARAVAEMARLAGASLSFDAEAGVISLARDGGAVADGFSGFKTGRPLSLVVDGKIVRAGSPRVVGGVPFLAPRELKRVAEGLGFSAQLDSGAGVLALKAGPAPSGPAAPSPASGMEETDTPEASGDVCAYMDRQKELWGETEPSEEEKETMRGLAAVLTDQQRSNKTGDPAQLKLLEETIRGFAQKVQRRLAGTRDWPVPSEAKPWRSVSVSFLENTQQVIDVALDLIRMMKESPDRQKAEFEKAKREISRIKSLQEENQSIGTEQVQETIQLRLTHGCSPP